MIATARLAMRLARICYFQPLFSFFKPNIKMQKQEDHSVFPAAVLSFPSQMPNPAYETMNGHWSSPDPRSVKENPSFYNNLDCGLHYFLRKLLITTTSLLSL